VSIRTRALRAIYDNLPEVVLGAKVAEPHATPKPDTEADPREEAALAVDHAVRREKMADWRGSPIKERRVARAIHHAVGPYKPHTLKILEIVKAQSEY